MNKGVHMSLCNAAVFRIRYSEVNERSATLQIATPLIDRLSNGIVTAGQRVALMMSNMRIGTMLPLSNVSFYDYTPQVLPLETDCVLQPPDSPVFMRDVATVIERLEGNLASSELDKLRTQLLAPRMSVYVYTYDSSRYFLRDVVSDALFESLMKMCSRSEDSDVQFQDICYDA